MLPTSRTGVLALWMFALFSMVVAVQLRAEIREPVRPIERAAERGWLEPGVPRLDPSDPIANAAGLREALALAGDPDGDPRECRAAARWFQLMPDGKQSRVSFSTRAVCQLKRLKQISIAQPQGLAEMAAFIVGTRHGRHVTVTRIVVPPFHFTHDAITFMPADLGPLQPDEKFIGTYHTHPDRDEEAGVPSDIDLAFIRNGVIDFHGQVGPLANATSGIDWLFDIVETRDGEWNVFAHDKIRLAELASICEREVYCPVDEMRLAGSRYYLLSRYYTE
jgi:proteasome lid subunit RPN8/RPN11